MASSDLARIDEYTRLIHERVSPKTATHCISTAEFLESFAAEAGISREQAATAGLLHDLCKALDADGFLAAARQYGITPRPTQLLVPKLLHGPIAAEECRRALGIADPSVYDAIYWHTTGRPEFGSLGLALYVADFAEPSRTYPEAEEARRCLRTNGFHAALGYVVRERLHYVERKEHIDEMTISFYRWLEAEVL